MSDLTIKQKCRIVDNAPNWAKAYNTKQKSYSSAAWFHHEVLLSDLKAQIDQHYYGQSEEKELEQYAILSKEKIEGGAVLVGGLSIQKMVDYQDVIADQQTKIDELQRKLDTANFFKKGDTATIENATQVMDEMRSQGRKLREENDQLKAEKVGLEKKLKSVYDFEALFEIEKRCNGRLQDRIEKGIRIIDCNERYIPLLAMQSIKKALRGNHE